MKIPYTYVRDKYYPIVEIILEHKNNIVEQSALIDSGATLSVFQGVVAEKLNIDLESGEKKVFQSATSKMVAYIHKLNITIGNHTFPCTIAFSNDLSTSFNLLGRETIFDKFLITFDEKNKEILLEKVD